MNEIPIKSEGSNLILCKRSKLLKVFTVYCHDYVTSKQYMKHYHLSKLKILMGIVNHHKGGAPFAKLVQIIPISLWFMVDILIYYSCWYKPTNITGGGTFPIDLGYIVLKYKKKHGSQGNPSK